MKEVAIELENIKISKRDSTIQANYHSPSCMDEGSVLTSDMHHTLTIESESISGTDDTWTTGTETIRSDSSVKPLDV